MNGGKVVWTENVSKYTQGYMTITILITITVIISITSIITM